MKKITKRSRALVAIVIYKAVTALLLAVTSIALILTFKDYENLSDFSQSYVLAGKIEAIKWLLEKILNFPPKTLKFSSLVAGSYSVVTAIEAIGLWYEKTWAKILVLVLVGISIPAEIFELIRGISLLKLVVFIINAAVFWYLLRHSLLAKDDE
ncbi:DUF2127 domain-containing protein [Argonema galeatum]|uniref:DUF2127 domain-containing protein n=1 Tax=Argonema galeatum TaxID=2942762 RepID=UPI0020110104|nr:DUF2127 domain-containing protein [Argonema galeatum]MCL1466056.1 DUF2127 domain-containing protein [Argonema galeatum A003/A1]